jgi:hypothetical protein
MNLKTECKGRAASWLIGSFLAAILVQACRPWEGERRFSAALARPAQPGNMDVPGRCFSWTGDFSKGLAPVRDSGLVGFIDSTGKTVVEPRFAFAGRFQQNRAPVLWEGKWGYLDTSGRLAIAPAFDWAGAFREGLAPVATDSGYGFIDTAGLPVGPRDFHDVRAFSEGYAAVRVGDREDGAWGFLDRRGRLAIPPLFANVVHGFSEGRAAVQVGAEPPYKTGFIDSSGGFAVDTLFDAAGDFSEGLAPVGRGEYGGAHFLGVWGYIDSSGRLAIPLAYSAAGDFQDGAALVRMRSAPGGTGHGCLIGRSGNILRAFPDSMEILPPVAAGMISFRLRGRYGYLDTAGEVAIPARFLEAGPFHHGWARARIGPERQGWIFINKDGAIMQGRTQVPSL